MKWTKELLKEIILMLEKGFSNKNISEKFNIKQKNIIVKLNRMGIKLSDYKKFKKDVAKKCLNCENKIKGEKRKFCSSSCASIYNNKKRKGKITEKQKNKVRLSQIKKLGFNSIEEWEDDKKNKIENKNKILKNGIYVCCKCDDSECKRPEICSNHFKKYNIFEKYLGFDKTKMGTKGFYDEFDRVVNNLKNDYYNEKMTMKEIASKYGMKHHSSIECLFHSLNLKTRNISESLIVSIEQGKINYDNMNISPYKHGCHITWDNRKVHYRSSYEVEYYKKLDEQKIYYEVEKLRIPYYDNQRNKKRIAIPDIYVSKQNLIIEIKSLWTYDEQNWKDRLKVYKNLNYNVKLVLNKCRKFSIENLEEINY